MWIKKEEKEKYTDSCKKTGLSVIYDKQLDQNIIKELQEFVKYLRKLYYFPIRCKVIFSNIDKFIHPLDKHIYYGVFFSNEEYKRKVYPKIYVASKVTDKNPIDDIYYCLIHELTHYFQWYFYEENKRTDKSLEIEANKWANYIISEFYDLQKTERGKTDE